MVIGLESFFQLVREGLQFAKRLGPYVFGSLNFLGGRHAFTIRRRAQN